MQKLFVCLALSLFSTLPYAASFEKSLDVLFPDEIAGLFFVDRKEFPQRELGIVLGYGRDQLRASVYIYTFRVQSIPNGADNGKVRQHFDQVIGDLKQLEALGQVQSISFSDARPKLTSQSDCSPQFLWSEYEMTLSEGLKLSSYTYLTGFRDNFVKLRISYKKDSAFSKRDVDRFVSQLGRIIGKCA